MFKCALDTTGSSSDEQENPLWSAITEPLSSLVGAQKNNIFDGNKKNNSSNNSNMATTENQEDAYRKRYRKRVQNLQKEVEDVNEEATKSRKQLWEAQDKLKDTEDKVRALENHLNEILELREKDLETIKTLRAANSDCVEMESRAREATDVFKKCYKRAQLKIKEDEEEIMILREQRDSAERGKDNMKGINKKAMVDESALKYIQTVSDDKEKRLTRILIQTKKDVDLWKSKYKVVSKRCQNWREQIQAMEHPTEAATHMEKQRITIEKLEHQVSTFEEKGENEREERDDEGDDNGEDEEHAMMYQYSRDSFSNVVNRAYCDEDLHDGLAKEANDLLKRIKNLDFSLPTMTKM